MRLSLSVIFEVMFKFFYYIMTQLGYDLHGASFEHFRDGLCLPAVCLV